MRRLPLRRESSEITLSISTFLCLCMWSIAKEESLSSPMVFRRGVFSLFMPLKLRSAAQVDTREVSNDIYSWIELGVCVSFGLFIVIVAAPFVFPPCDFVIELIPGDLHITSVVIVNVANDSFC